MPGRLVLIGSGETAPSGKKALDRAFQGMPRGARVAVLETPAGFEPNSARVAGAVAAFIRERMPHFAPSVDVVPARRRGTERSPDDPAMVAPLVEADLVYMGAGSPTYAVAQLAASKVWQTIVARHRLGSRLVAASAAALAVGSHTLPVYEMYKLGHEPHWWPGLDLLGPFGLSLAVVPHWNNTDGGEALDTSRCYIGRERFDPLLEALPPGVSVVGLEERTSLVVDFSEGSCEAVGAGAVVVAREGRETRLLGGERAPLSILGAVRPAPSDGGLPAGTTAAVRLEAQRRAAARDPEPSETVQALVRQRAEARSTGDWELADRLRDELLRLGWTVRDTETGPQLVARGARRGADSEPAWAQSDP